MIGGRAVGMQNNVRVRVGGYVFICISYLMMLGMNGGTILATIKCNREEYTYISVRIYDGSAITIVL